MKDLIVPPGTDDGGSTPWYALHLGPNRQFRVRETLRERGFEEYLPTTFEVVRWSDRESNRERPLFPGYILARFPLNRRGEIESLTGVLGIVSTSKQPAAIADCEVETLRRVVQFARDPQVCAYSAGQVIQIARGPLAGVSGTVTRTKGSVRLTVAIEILRRAVSVEIDAADAEEGDL